jgi:DNA modification methylase
MIAAMPDTFNLFSESQNAGGESSDHGLLIRGDCFDVAQVEEFSGSIAMVYLDPPFGTGRLQPYRFGMAGEERSFADERDPDAWIARWLPRIDAMILTLRRGGILVVHLDPRLASLLRVALDARLGGANFLNEIVWHYRSGGVARDRFPWKHDTLLVYRNGPGHIFHPLTEKRYLAHRVNRPGVEEFQDAGGWYRHARIDDVWEIPFLPADSKERLGYPTQKPEALAERLLAAFTDPGDPVADFACGSGTFPSAAERCGRRWVAGDVDPRAIACTAARIARIHPGTLRNAWNEAGIDGRRRDLKERLLRLRSGPETWGLTPEERASAGFRIREIHGLDGPNSAP